MKVMKLLTVLYAEDDEILQTSIGNILKQIFKEVIFACDGIDAIKKVEASKPNIIIMDVMMPKMNGIDAIKQIRKIDSKIPIIILSSSTETKYLLEAIKLNLVEYLVKPFSFTELKDVLYKASEILRGSGQLTVMLCNGMEYNGKLKILKENDTLINLTSIETVIIDLLLEYKNTIVTYEMISNVFEYKSIDAIRNTVARLRKKLGRECIENVFESGYRLKI